MVKVSIRVHSGAARFDVALVGDSLQQALGLITERYGNSDVRVRFPSDLAGLSADGPAAPTEGFSQPDTLLAA